MARNASASGETGNMIGAIAKDNWLRKQYEQLAWEDVEHLIMSGRILHLAYDFEATDLNPMFASPTQFSGKIVTLDGKIVDKVKLDIRVPEDVVISPQAAIVTQSYPQELYHGKGRIPPHIAAAKIMLFFRNPYRALWDRLESAATIITSPAGKEEEVRVYVITSPDGTKKAEIRIHQGGKFLSFVYPDKVDHICDVMQKLVQEQPLLEPVAAVLGIEQEMLEGAGGELRKEVLERRIRAFEGKEEGFLKALKDHMGASYPLALDRIPKEERLPDGARTYRDANGKRWKKIAAPALTEGHNIRRYDDRLLWSFLHRSMSDEIFLTHTKKFQRFRVDTLELAKLAALLDQDGVNGFKPGVRINRETGEPCQSFTLSDLMEANTRDAVPELGIDEGVRMPDGSKYDAKRAHADAAYDVDAVLALRAYLRKRMPKLVRRVEINAEFERVKPFLIGGEGFEMHPLRAFARKIYPQDAGLHFGVCVGINEEIEERRQALMIRTDTDQKLEDYTYKVNGKRKHLLDMSVEELAIMLKAQHRTSDALCEMVELRKNPPVVEAEMAFKRGIGGDPEKHEANRRFVLAHEELRNKLKKAHSMAMPSMPDWRSIRNPQAEEHLFTGLAAPKHYEFEMDGKKVLLVEAVHREWEKLLRRNRNIDAVLHRAVKAQTIECEVREDTLKTFIERMLTVDKHLQKYLGADAAPHYDTHEPSLDLSDAEMEAMQEGALTAFTMLPPPDRPFIPPKWDMVPDMDRPEKMKKVPHVMSHEECAELTANAVEYLWKLRAELMYEFHDNSTRCTVQDRHGHDIPFPALNRMKEGDVADRLRTEEYHIIPEELNWSSKLLARMFRDAGRIEWVKRYWEAQDRPDMVADWKKWESYLAAKPALTYHGAPHEDPDQQRWISATKGLKEVARIRANLRSGDVRAGDDEWGLWDIFMRNHEEAERILDECEAFYRKQLKENPLTEEKLRLLGYNPATGLPIEHARYEIPAGAKILTIDVPDRMLEAPLSHHHVAQNILMLAPGAEQRKLIENRDKDTYLFLRAAQTGRTFLAAKPIILSSEDIRPNPYFREIYEAAARRYEDSGMPAPAAEDFVPLAVEALAPVPGNIDRKAQTVKMRWDDFVATVSPELGHRDEVLTGLVMKDYGFTPTPGAARLQGMQQGGAKPGKEESGWEVPANVTRVRTLTLKEAHKRIKAGQEQIKAAAALGENSVEALRAGLANGIYTETQIRKSDVKNMPSLRKLMSEKSFTPRDAVHYGYASLTDMKSKLTAFFVDHELDAGRDDNRIHFIDIDPPEKAVSWYHPARCPMVRLAIADEKPDPTHVHGAPDITRGHGTQRQKGK